MGLQIFDSLVAGLIAVCACVHVVPAFQQLWPAVSRSSGRRYRYIDIVQ